MASETQSFEKHAQWTPAYHFFSAPLAIAYLIWAVKRVVSNPTVDTEFALVGALALAGLAAVSRLSPIRVQDRLIRLEERVRLAKLLPADLQSRIDELTPRQLVAIRFASDEEVTDLVRKVLAAPSMTQKQIKAEIKRWKADHFRA